MKKELRLEEIIYRLVKSIPLKREQEKEVKKIVTKFEMRPVWDEKEKMWV